MQKVAGEKVTWWHNPRPTQPLTSLIVTLYYFDFNAAHTRLNHTIEDTMYNYYMLIQENSAKVGRCHSNIKSKKEKKKQMKKC